MKRGLVVGAGLESIYAIKKLRNQGINLLGIDGDEEAKGLKYVNKKKIVDITNFENVEQVLLGEKIDFIVPVPLGKVLTTVGYLNDKYNLKGISYEAAKNCTDKLLFNKLLFNANLRNIKSLLIEKNCMLVEEKMFYPSILKPRYGSGSKGIYILEKETDFERIKYIKFKEDYILEELVPGKEYGIDGVILDKRVDILLIREKENIKCQAVSYYSVIEEEMYSRVKSFIEKVLKNLRLNNVIFHADLIINDSNIFIIELSGRPSGHNLHNYFTPMVIGIDILDNYFNFIFSKEYSFEVKTRKMMLLKYIELENCIIRKVPLIDELKKQSDIKLVDFKCNLKIGQKLGEIKNGNSIMERGFFILEGENKENLKKQVEKIMSYFIVERIENGY